MSAEVPSELRACIGSEATYTAPEEIGRASIRLFALAMQDDNPLHHDQDAAAASRHGGIIASPTLVCETNQFYRCAATEAGYFGHLWDLPGLGGEFLRGGNEYEFNQPVRPEDRVTVTWKILDIQVRQTREGGRLIVVTSEARFVNQHGDLLAVNRETNLHRA